MKRSTLIFALAASSFLVQHRAVAADQRFTGSITDEMCANTAGHSGMRMGPTDAECAMACVDAHGAMYVLYDGKNVYTLSDQRTPAKFAGQKVRVVGTLDSKTKTIRVKSISAAR
jgi:hypothetical protein